MTRSQHFAVWYLFSQEKRDRERMRDPKRFFSVLPCSTIRIATLRNLQEQGLVEPFQGTETRRLSRGGRSLIKVGYTKTSKVERWRLTEKGRELGATLAHPGSRVP